MILESIKGIREGGAVMMPEGKSVVSYLDNCEINTLCRRDTGIVLTQRWIGADKKVDYKSVGQRLTPPNSGNYIFQNKMLAEAGL